jgi:hypothetical protein
MTNRIDQHEVAQIEQILRGISADAYTVIKMILALEQEHLHKSEPLAWNTVRDEMIKKAEGIA